MALSFRLIQGSAMCIIITTLYSICTNFYPEHRMTMIGYIQAVEVSGFVLGPALGSFLYTIGGYNFVFISFGALNIIISLLIKCIFDKSVDKIDHFEPNSQPQSLKALDLLKEPRFLFAGLSATLVYAIWAMIEACMAIRFTDFNLNMQ